jgi:transcriptional regulator with XRE-family HTH domain
MARELGIQRTQWIKYENGNTVPGADILAKICRVHACSADWLLGLKDRNDAISVRAGDGAAVAIGTGSTATVTPAPAADCRKCPYKAAVKKLQKAGMTLVGV